MMNDMDNKLSMEEMETHSDTGFDPFDKGENESGTRHGHSLMHITRAISTNPVKGKGIDPSVVAFPFYNSFNYSFLSKDKRDLYLTVGVTSANPGEGKTLVASNLAVSLALAFQRRTILVDLNLQQPRLHDIFGASLSPGFSEALTGGSISVTATQVENLAVLTAGTLNGHHQPTNGSNGNGSLKRKLQEPSVGLQHLSAFRDILYSLEEEYDFVIVDLPSINVRNFPVLFASQLNGLIVVVDSGKTKKEDLENMFRQISERQVLGFVFNRAQDGKA